MVILALETATRDGSAAVWIDGVCRSTTGGAAPVTHAERLPGTLARLLETEGRTLHDVDRFAVVVGPGSFTGIRVGVAAIQGLAHVSGKSVVPVPTLDALADGWIAEAKPADPRMLVSVIDGHRAELFFAAWRTMGADPIEACPLVIAPRVGRIDDLAGVVDALSRLYPVVVCAQPALRAALMTEAVAAKATWAPVATPLAEIGARLAARRPEAAVAPHALRPVYVRRPDAELARERAAGIAHPVPSEPSGFNLVQMGAGDDLSGIERLQHASFTNPWRAEAIAKELVTTDVARLYALRAPDGTLVAFCACWMVFDELHINSLAVDPALRRRGLARRLLAFVFAEAVGQGARSATLEVRESNQAARRLYESLGFDVVATRRDYYQDPREDALILWHRALPAAQRLW